MGGGSGGDAEGSVERGAAELVGEEGMGREGSVYEGGGQGKGAVLPEGGDWREGSGAGIREDEGRATAGETVGIN